METDPALEVCCLNFGFKPITLETANEAMVSDETPRSVDAGAELEMVRPSPTSENLL